MKVRTILLLCSSSLCAGLGQVLFKMGAGGANSWKEFLNFRIGLGLFLYIVSTVIWIYALSFARLHVVYAFTTLTFAFVYLLSAIVLRERFDLNGVVGVLFVLLGLYFIISKGTAHG